MMLLKGTLLPVPMTSLHYAARILQAPGQSLRDGNQNWFTAQPLACATTRLWSPHFPLGGPASVDQKRAWLAPVTHCLRRLLAVKKSQNPKTYGLYSQDLWLELKEAVLDIDNAKATL